MADDVDDLLKRAMKTLDDQVPSGYFEDLPSRTLARLEGQMQQSGTDSDKAPSTGVPPAKEEDSGLHDIRSLASSTKARLSSRRSSQNPIIPDEDILASSSAGWKAVALPEPAKMVSLPELAELPSKKEIKRAEQKAADAPAAAPVTPIASRAAKPATKKGPLIAIAGIGVAAAAAAVIFVTTQSSSKDTAATENVAMGPAPATQSAKPKVESIAQDPAFRGQGEGQNQAVAGGAGSAAPVAAADTAPVEAKPPAAEPTTPPPAAPAKTGKHKTTVTKAVPPPAVDKPEKLQKDETKKAPEGGKKSKDGDNEPSFDELLKEAGVNQQKVEAKPKLAKKSLSGDDIKHGMGSVAAKAQACYAGQQGTAAVKLTVTPDGKVEKVKVTGAFAGTPVGACVEAAVKSASFPPWDGGPQSFGYSYLLSE